MKIECVKERIEQAISFAEKVTSKASTLPVLKCLYLQAEKGELIVKATNLDLGIEVRVPVKIQKEGVVAVPANVIAAFVSQVRGERSITLEEIDGNLRVSAGRHATLIKCLPHEEFPAIPRLEDGKTISLPSDDIVRGLRSVWYASSASSMKPELSSVYVYGDEADIVFVATDAFRLAEKRVKNKKAKEVPALLIPHKNVAEIIRVLSDYEGDITMVTDKDQISFEFDSVYLTSRVVDGAFPDYKALIPKTAATEAVLLRQDLVTSLKVATIFSDKFNKVVFKVEPKEQFFEIKTKNSDVGESSNAIQATLSGDPIEISFNHKNIFDAFQALESDSLSLALNGLAKPLLIRGVGDDSFSYIVMPMNK